ncbi:MAG: DUF5357 family protein [Leptolyngbyaceae cyanobacterium bins.59]|nr:DUF5357 family protein [Leptolyngbyaceae cyanobacterium bins.59]
MFDWLKSQVAWIQKELLPEKAFSWQTLAWLSAFSYLMAALASPLVRELLSLFGWVFLIAAVAWVTKEHPVKVAKFDIGPWITGALVTTLFFGNLFDEVPSVPLVSWPIISSLIASGPRFFKDGKAMLPGPKDRQEITVLILSNLVISCWFQFYFTVQGWSQQYPALMSSYAGRDSLIARFGFPVINAAQGQAILERAGEVLDQQLQNKLWSQVELWLLDLRRQPDRLNQLVKERLDQEAQNPLTRRGNRAIEEFLWKLEARIVPGNPYTLQLFAIWQGPSLNQNGYYLTRSCEITEVQPSEADRAFLPEETASDPDVTLGRISCGPISRPLLGQPPAR